MTPKEKEALMGRRVVVLRQLVKNYDDFDNRVWVDRTKGLKPFGSGWIVGFRLVRDIHYSSSCVPVWQGQKITKTINCILVCLSPNTKPIHVPYDGFELEVKK